MRAATSVLALSGGVGLTIGIGSGLALRRVRRYGLTVAAVGVVMVIVWCVFLAISAARGCGQSCVVDVSPGIALIPFQVVGFVLGATVAAMAVPSRRAPHPGCHRRAS